MINKLTIKIKNINRVTALGALIALVSSITPFYGIAYIVAIMFGIHTLKFTKTFSSKFGRLILSGMLLASVIMFTGLLSWLAGIDNHPLSVLVLYGSLLLAYNMFEYEDVSTSKIIDGGDIVSILLALVAPIIIYASYQLPNPSNAATYQFIHSGWDNASHLLMLQTASLEKGYVYGNYDDVIDTTISGLNAYPQAWHLATANLSNGFGANLFNPDKPITALSAYVIVFMLWYVVAVYVFSKASWAIIEDKIYKNNKLTTLALFSVANVLIQMTVYWSSLTSAFANYIGMLAFIAMMVVMVIENNRDNHKATLSTAILMAGAATLSWFLPLPALGLILLMSFFFLDKFNKKTIGVMLKKTGRIPLFLLIGVGSLMLLQVVIFMIFSGIEGSDQLNTGRLVASFGSNQVIFLILFAFTVIVWHKINKTDMFSKLVAVVAPFAILTSALYVFQLTTSGELSYYFGKVIAITIAVTGIFFTPAFVNCLLRLRKHKVNSLSIVFCGLAVIGVILVGSDRSVNGFSELLQRSSTVSLEVSAEIVSYLKNKNPDKTELVILRHSNEDLNGQVITKIQHTPLTCAHSITARSFNDDLDRKLTNLDSCADALNEKIIVITSSESEEGVRLLDNDNIEIINTP